MGNLRSKAVGQVLLKSISGYIYFERGLGKKVYKGTLISSSYYPMMVTLTLHLFFCIYWEKYFISNQPAGSFKMENIDTHIVRSLRCMCVCTVSDKCGGGLGPRLLAAYTYTSLGACKDASHRHFSNGDWEQNLGDSLFWRTVM